MNLLSRNITYTYFLGNMEILMIDKLIETGGCYGMEMNVQKKIIENFKTNFPSKNYDRPKTTRQCGIF
jgi:hypothetical protein